MAILSKYLAYICLPNRAAKRRPEEKEPERVKPQVSEEKDEDEKVSSCFLILLCFLHPKVIFFFLKVTFYYGSIHIHPKVGGVG